MPYSKEEKSRIDGLLEVFSDYIKGHYYFDIVYSEKVGYVRLVVAEDGSDMPPVFIGSYDELLEVLFNEVAVDVYQLKLEGPHFETSLTPLEQIETRKRLLSYIDKMGVEEKEYALEFLETFLIEYNQK